MIAIDFLQCVLCIKVCLHLCCTVSCLCDHIFSANACLKKSSCLLVPLGMLLAAKSDMWQFIHKIRLSVNAFPMCSSRQCPHRTSPTEGIFLKIPLPTPPSNPTLLHLLGSNALFINKWINKCTSYQKLV